MTDVKWIKIVVDIFDDEKIQLIESLPDGDAIVVCWFKLLCLAGKTNNSGVMFLVDKIAYTDEMLATIFRKPLQTVRLALSTFEQFGMVEIVNGVITIPNWEKHQTLDEMERVRQQTRERVSRYREKQKLLTCNVTEPLHVTECNGTDIDIEEEKEKEIDYMSVLTKWNEIGLNTIRDIKGQRRTLLRARVKDYGIEAVFEAIENVRNSDFLRGQGKNGWTATFDWFVKPNNFQKVLEGNYTNKTKKGKVDLSDVKSMLKPAKDINTLLDEMDRL